jgi:hypothetical protein
MSTSENNLIFRDSCVSSVLKSSCISYTLRFCARGFLALTKNKSIFKGTLTLFISTILLSSPVQAVDIENGKALHDANCLRCHDETNYTRPNRIVDSYDALRKRISDCEIMAEMAWFEEEIDDVTAYLNDAFYRFELEK